MIDLNQPFLHHVRLSLIINEDIHLKKTYKMPIYLFFFSCVSGNHGRKPRSKLSWSRNYLTGELVLRKISSVLVGDNRLRMEFSVMTSQLKYLTGEKAFIRVSRFVCENDDILTRKYEIC